MLIYRKGRGAGLGSEGFTLLEVMISLALLAGVVFTVLASLSFHMGVVQRSTDTVVATMLGRRMAEEAALGGAPAAGTGSFDPPYERFSWGLARTGTEVPGIERVGITVGPGGKDYVSFVSFFEE